MSRAKPYPSDPAFRAPLAQVDEPAVARTAANLGIDVTDLSDEELRRLGVSQPVTAPTAAPGGPTPANSVRGREEGLGVDPALVEGNLAALAELHEASQGTGGTDNTPAPPAATKAAASTKKATDRQSQTAKPPTTTKKAPAKKAAAKK